MRIDIRPGVLGLPSLEQNIGDDVVHLVDEFEHRVVRQVLKSKLALRHVAGVGLAKDGVAIAGDDLTSLERGPDVFANSVVRRVLADLRLHLAEPNENLLVRKTVKGTSETIQRGTESKEGVGEGRANELASVSRDVTTLMVGMNGDVETHELNEVGLVSEAKEVGKVVGVVLLSINSRKLATAVDITENATGNVGELSNAGFGPLGSVHRRNPIQRMKLTGPWRPRRWAASTPSWKYPAGTPSRMRNRG